MVVEAQGIRIHDLFSCSFFPLGGKWISGGSKECDKCTCADLDDKICVAIVWLSDKADFHGFVKVLWCLQRNSLNNGTGDESIAIVYKASSTPSVAGFVLLIDIDWWDFLKQANRCCGQHIYIYIWFSTFRHCWSNLTLFGPSWTCKLDPRGKTRFAKPIILIFRSTQPTLGSCAHHFFVHRSRTVFFPFVFLEHMPTKT